MNSFGVSLSLIDLKKRIYCGFSVLKQQKLEKHLVFVSFIGGRGLTPYNINSLQGNFLQLTIFTSNDR